MCEVFDVLLGDACSSNMGGTKLKLHYALSNDILTFGKPAASPTNPEEKYIITTAHVFKPGKCFKTIEITRNSGGLSYGAGGANSGTKVPSAVFQLPSNNRKALALYNLANGITPLIVLVEDANMPDGTYDQLGTEKHYAIMTATKVPGTNDGDGGMYEFTVTATMPYRMLYEASVAMTPAA